MAVPFLRTAYNYDRNQASDESGLDCGFDPVTGEITPSMTKQSFAEEADINTIVRRFNLTGQLPVGVRAPTYADFSDIPDYHEAMTALRQADESFMAMPAETRARFHNDPHEFVGFLSDEKNRAEAVKMGLVLPAAAALAAAGGAVQAAPGVGPTGSVVVPPSLPLPGVPPASAPLVT